MNTVQLGIRIPSSLNQRLTAFMAQTGISKTEVVINALASYMWCMEEVPLNERVASLEAKVMVLEGLVKGSQAS
jgi:predicted DNA-binding protein